MIPRSLAFLFARSSSEQLAAEHVVREHHRGRALADILHDPYITGRCTPAEIDRLLERREVLHAIGEDTVAAHIRSSKPQWTFGTKEHGERDA